MPCDGGEPRVIRLVFDSDPLAVRAALRMLFDGRSLRLLPEDERGTAEIVLAEVLNNVVEHAYASASGEIEVTVQITAAALTCTIIDRGRPMPGNALPVGTQLPALGEGDLPEGGFAGT